MGKAVQGVTLTDIKVFKCQLESRQWGVKWVERRHFYLLQKEGLYPFLATVRP